MKRRFTDKAAGKVRRCLLFCLLFFLPFGLNAQTDSIAITYTQQRPLVYEDCWDLWPYSFLNENGQPDGFNVELIKLICKELDIPYTIKLKSRQEAFNDLRDGKSDLTMALSAGYHDEYGHYGQNTITLFTQSVATPKGKPIEIVNFRDLGKHKVIVNDNSLSHHLMQDYGWSENAIPTKDIRTSIRQLSVNEEGQILWNTLSLKWIIHQFQIDNLNITPVNMPHGEYKFMSNDMRLLNKLDSIFTVLSTDEKLLAMQNKWFYPERQEKTIPSWVWYVVGISSLLALILLIYGIVFRVQANRITKENSIRNKRLALIMRTSKLRMWTFDTTTRIFTWHNEDGLPAFNYTAEEFAHRYPPEDYEKLMAAIHEIEKSGHDHDEYVTIQLKALDSEDGDSELRDFMVTLSVLRRDKTGQPTVLIGTKKDITTQQARLSASESHQLRYWSIFNSPMLGILLFDKDGQLTNINDKACEILGRSRDELTGKAVTYHELLDIPDDVTPDKADGYAKGNTRLSTVWGDHEELIGVFAFCRDVAWLTQKQHELKDAKTTLAQKNSELDTYVSHINYILEKGPMRLVSYSPASHTVTIYRQIDQQQLVLTQTRCMTFIDNRYQRKVMHMLNDMDSCLNKSLEADIKTNIRARGGLMLHLQVKLLPVMNKDGEVTEYFGVCQDISELKKSESLMTLEALKAQEIENTQNKFLRNMLSEIRTPLNVVVETAAKLDTERPDEEGHDSNLILTNVQRLLQLINNILYMSRLEAHMVEINKQPTDFAEIFKSQCMTGWSQYRRDSVRYITEIPYEKLVVDIDAANLGHVIERVTAMSARNTLTGTIRARFDYIGRKLMIFVEDTGEGIDDEELLLVQKEYVGSPHTSKGLSLAICKELIDQMGGTFEINSEKGVGTTVWISLPCHATEVKRRKTI